MKFHIKIAHIKPRFFKAVRRYSLRDLKKDVPAGITVGIVAVPLASALAIASGLPPERGFLTAIAAGFVAACLGGSRFQVSGPTAAFVVVVYGVVERFGYDGLVLATVLAGLILLIFAFTRMGSYIKYIPYPVILGFTAGIAVVLFSTELKDFLGLRMGEVPADFVRKFKAYAEHIHTINLWALLTASFTVALVLVTRKKTKKIPAQVFAIAMATSIAALFDIPVETIGSRFGDLPRVIPAPHIPNVSFESLRYIIPSALTIAILAAVESLLSAVVADGMTGDRHNSDTELFGQGMGNIASAFCGGIPATGAVARTVTNITSGARTPVAGMIHAVTLFVFILFCSDLVESIPMPAIAGMLSVIAWDMFDAGRVKHFLKGTTSDVAIMLTVFFLTLLIDITVAVEVGVVMAALLFIKRMSDSITLSPLDSHTNPNDLAYKNIPKGVSIYEINGPFFFGAATNLIRLMEREVGLAEIMILRMRRVPIVDATGLRALESFVQTCKDNNVLLILSGVQPQPFRILMNSGMVAKLGEKNVCDHIDKALARAREILAVQDYAVYGTDYY